jgi:hypothetical protein
MKTIRHTTTLFYYDGPQVFEARDTIGGHYVAVMVASENGADRYLVAGVAPERLRQFRAGTLDLRTLLSEGVAEEWYLTTVATGLDQPLALVPQTTPLAESGLLPDEGFLLHDRPTEELALKEARARNNLVLEVAAEPPEAAEEHRIRVGTLIGLLSHVQTMIKHAYGAALRTLSPADRREIDKTDAHLMDVVIPAAAGSFRVVLEAAKTPDLLGQSELARALQRVDQLFEDAGDPQKALATVKALTCVCSASWCSTRPDCVTHGPSRVFPNRVIAQLQKEKPGRWWRFFPAFRISAVSRLRWLESLTR